MNDKSGKGPSCVYEQTSARRRPTIRDETQEEGHMKEISIKEIEGIKIGNAQDEKGGTGCTVILCPEGAAG